MSVKTRPISKNLFRTNLDGEIGSLSGRTLKSVLGFFAHLESLARHGGPDGLPEAEKSSPPRSRPGTNMRWLELPQIEKVSFRELGRQVIRAAQGQVRSLQERLLQLQSLVLINDWAVAERLWAGLVPDCKTPLFELSFLEELWGINADQLQVNGWSLTRQWHEFVLLQAEFELLLGRRRSLVELSDALERDLGHWLRRFVELLNKLDEASAA